jgi:hypothetical protein
MQPLTRCCCFGSGVALRSVLAPTIVLRDKRTP